MGRITPPGGRYTPPGVREDLCDHHAPWGEVRARAPRGQPPVPARRAHGAVATLGEQQSVRPIVRCTRRPYGERRFGGRKRIAPGIDERAGWSRPLLGRLCPECRERYQEIADDDARGGKPPSASRKQRDQHEHQCSCQQRADGRQRLSGLREEGSPLCRQRRERLTVQARGPVAYERPHPTKQSTASQAAHRQGANGPRPSCAIQP